MTHRILVVTGTRAEYGLFRGLLDLLEADPDLEPRLIVTGAHLSSAHGHTVEEIEADGRDIAARVPIDVEDVSETGVARAFGSAVAGIAPVLTDQKPAMLMVLGDRYEALAAAIAAHLQRVPVAHLHGGELTFGSLDDGMRHAITKLSTLHFTATRDYRRRVIQMGEDPQRVFSVGSLGVDNAMRLSLTPGKELWSELGHHPEATIAVVTFHPVTTLADHGFGEAVELFAALDSLKSVEVLVTSPNVDSGSQMIDRLAREWVAANHERASYHESLGSLRYLSAIAAASVVVGNSSSGLIEAPSLGTPTVNIGERQAGRTRASSVLDVAAERSSIVQTINKAIRLKEDGAMTSVANPYGDGRAASQILDCLHQWFRNATGQPKRFFDMVANPEQDV